MHIGLLGWYGHENAGDDRMELSIRRLVAPHPAIAIDIDDRWIPILSKCEFVIVGGGSLFFEDNPAAERILAMLKSAGVKRYVLWGVGIDGYSPTSKEALSKLIDGAVACVVRDKASRDRAPSARKVDIGPDLTWVVPYEVPSRTPAEQVAVNVLPGVHAPDVTFIAEAIRKEGLAPVGWPLCFAPAGLDSDPLKKAGIDYPNSFIAHVLMDSRFAVLMRYHAMVFATQVGTPFVPIATHPKQFAFLEEIQYPIEPVPLDQPHLVADRLHQVIAEEERIREHLRVHRTRLAAKAEEVHGRLIGYVDRGLPSRLGSRTLKAARALVSRVTNPRAGDSAAQSSV